MYFKLNAIALLFSSLSLAGILENIGNPIKTISASGIDVAIYKQTKFHLKDSPLDGQTLYLTGMGIREKKIVFINVNVYLAVSYVSMEEPLDLEKPLNSLDKCQVKALRLTFLRDVDAEKIRNSFSDALKSNGIDVDSTQMQSVLSKLDFDVAKGTTLTLLGMTKNPKLETVIFELPSKTLQSEGFRLASDFWKIWFGVPSDGGMENLKPELIRIKKLLGSLTFK